MAMKVSSGGNMIQLDQNDYAGVDSVHKQTLPLKGGLCGPNLNSFPCSEMQLPKTEILFKLQCYCR